MYVLLNYGDFIDGSTSNTTDPYVQFVSTTNPAAAHADFVATRLQGNESKSFFDKHKIPLIVGAVVVALGVFSTIVSLITRRRRKVYRPLFEPAPAGDMQIQHVAGYKPAPAPQYAFSPQYPNPWDGKR